MTYLHTYWKGSRNGKIVRDCQKTWNLLPKDWRVVDYSNDPLMDFRLPANYDSLPPNLQSDVIRLNALYLYGGIWLDYTIYFNESPHWLINELERCERTGRYGSPWMLSEHPESWLIVATPGSRHIEMWLEKLNELCENYPLNLYSKAEPELAKYSSYYYIYQSFVFLTMYRSDFTGPDPIPYPGAGMSSTWNETFGPRFRWAPFGRRPIIKYSRSARKMFWPVEIATICFEVFLLLLFVKTVLVRQHRN